MVISASLQACGVVFPFAMLTSICRSIVTICSGLYLCIGMTSFSSKWILSHSTWYKNPRSGHPRLEVNRLRRGFLREASLLVAAHVLRLNVGNKALLEVRAEMLEVVALDTLRRFRKGQALKYKPFVS